MVSAVDKRRSIKIEEMLEGFIKTFSKYSLDQTTIQKLAKEMEMTPSLIYTYFENKDDIVFKCTQYHHEKIQRGIIAALNLDFESDLHQGPENVMHYVDSKLEICSFLLQVMAHPKYCMAMEDSKFMIDRCMLQYTGRLVDLYQISPRTADGIALLINSIINDYILKKSKERFYLQFDCVVALLKK